jgi:transaldolase
MINNKLGDGSGAGEMAVLSSQEWVTRLSGLNEWPTRLIAASLRNFEQLELLAGTDVYTMPPKVAAAGRASLKGNFVSRIKEKYPVSIFDSARDSRVNTFWEVNEKVVRFAEGLAARIPETGDELVKRAHDSGCGEMFPFLNTDEVRFLDSDGKIPVHSRWEKRIREGSIAPDTLLTLAGLASFTADQGMLDKRIRGIIG